MAGELFIVLGFFLFLIACLAVGIFLFIFWILMIVDCAKRKFRNENEKIIWIIVIALGSWIGAIIYYFVIKREDKN